MVVGMGWAATLLVMSPGMHGGIPSGVSDLAPGRRQRRTSAVSRARGRQKSHARRADNIYEARDDRHLGRVPELRRGQPCYRPFAFHETQLFSPFQWRFNNGVLWEMHNGLDLLVPVGRPVPSATYGEVVDSGEDDAYSIYVKIRVVPQVQLKGERLPRGRQYEIIYTHLSQADVSVGQWVLPGDQIGLSGETGFHGIPHLHLSVVERHGNSGPFFYIDPGRFLNVCTYSMALEWPHRPNARQRVLVRDTGTYHHGEFVERSVELTGRTFDQARTQVNAP